jgi:hypothetical protein
METTGRDLKKRIDLPPFVTVDDMEKADRLKSMVTNLQFLGLSDDYIKGLQTERQRNQGHQSIKVSRSFFDPNRFVLAHWLSGLLLEETREPGENHRPATSH